MTSERNPDYWKLRPRAPAPGTALGPLDELPDGSAREYVFGRGVSAFSMFVVRKGMQVYGYLNICPHYSQPLNYRSDQFLNETGAHIRCTMHFAEFRIEDGFGILGAAENCWLDPVPVEVEDGLIRIAVTG
jgi:nitrite reductase/ring-hydroxylating ferredoxin subunit